MIVNEISLVIQNKNDINADKKVNDINPRIIWIIIYYSWRYHFHSLMTNKKTTGMRFREKFL